MSDARPAKSLSGACLCGAVQVRATTRTGKLRSCHCDMCRKLNSAMFMSLDTEQDSIEISGEVAEYRSSDWAKRGFCPTCGSSIWYGAADDSFLSLAAGLFDDAGGGTLTVEFFADACPASYALADRGQKKLTTQETIDLFTGGTD